jgi:predicted DNA-binding protein
MTQMIRKHFLLPQPLDERIKFVARRDHKSEAEVIRKLLESGLETKQEQSVGQALRALAALLARVKVEIVRTRGEGEE